MDIEKKKREDKRREKNGRINKTTEEKTYL